jgi:hypothetical protein
MYSGESTQKRKKALVGKSGGLGGFLGREEYEGRDGGIGLAQTQTKDRAKRARGFWVVPPRKKTYKGPGRQYPPSTIAHEARAKRARGVWGFPPRKKTYKGLGAVST